MQLIILFIFSSYFLTGFQFFAVAGYGITILDFAFLLFYGLIIKRIFWNGEEIKFSLTPPLIFLIVLFGSIIVSGLTPLIEGQSTWITQYFKSSIHFYYLAGFTLICAIYPIDKNIWTNVIKLFIGLSLIINIFGIYQIIARAFELPLAWINFNNVSLMRGAESQGPFDEIKQLSLHYGNFFRATSIFSEPSALGAFNTYILSFLLVPIVFRFKHFVKSKLLLISATTFSIAGLLFTFSMTAFVGIGLVLGFMFMLQRIKNIARFAYITISIFVIIFIADSIFSENLGISVVELFSKRIEGIVDFGKSDKEMFGESFGIRLQSAQKAFEIWQEYPVNGIGLGLTSSNKINNLAFADFTVFGILAELGIIGILSFLSFFFSLVFISFRFIKDTRYKKYFDEEELRLMTIIFFMLLVQFLINFISGNAFIQASLWVPMALVLSIINHVYIKLNKKIIRLKLVKEPLKSSFTRYLRSEHH